MEKSFLICILLVSLSYCHYLRQKNHPVALLPHYGDCSTSDDFLGKRFLLLLIVLSWEFHPVLPRPLMSGALWRWGGIRSTACKHVFDSNPTNNSYSSLCSLLSIFFLFSFSWNSRKNPKYPLRGSTQHATAIYLSPRKSVASVLESEYLSGSNICNFITPALGVWKGFHLFATPPKQEWYLLPS